MRRPAQHMAALRLAMPPNDRSRAKSSHLSGTGTRSAPLNAPRHRLTRREVSIIGVTFVGHALCHASVLIVTGLFVPLRAEFGLSKFWVTALPMTGYVLMGVGAVPAGMMTDRWGGRRVLTIYFLLTGLASAAAAMAPNAWVFAAALTALGAAVSLYHPTGLALISHGVTRRGHALGIHGVAGSLGLAGSAFGLWMGSLGSWRAAYWVVAIVATVGGAALLASPRGQERARGALSQTPDRTPASSGNGLFALLILLYAAMMLSGFNYRSLMTALPTYLTATAGGVYTGGDNSGVVLLVFVCGALGQYVFGRLADHTDPIRLYVTAAALSVPMALLLAASAGIGAMGAAAAMGLAMVHFGTQPTENLLIAQHTPPRLRSTSYGLKFLVTFGFGAMGAPTVGLLWSRTGTFAWTFVLFAVIASVVSTLIVVLARTVKSKGGDAIPRA